MKANTPLNFVLPSLAASLMLAATSPAQSTGAIQTAPDKKPDAPLAKRTAAEDRDAAARDKEKDPEKASDKAPDTENATGKVFSVDPTLLSVATEGNPTPIQFVYGKDTPYVDEDGKTVPMDLIRPELPVTVEYTTSGETLTAKRIVVTRSTLVGDGNKAPEKARAELAETKSREDSRGGQSEGAPQTVIGTVSNVEQTIAVTARGETTPRSVVVNNSTRYVNASGQPVSSGLIFSGMPVTIRSVKDGERHVALEVIVRGDPGMAPAGMPGAVAGTAGQGGQGTTQSSTGGGTTGGGTTSTTNGGGQGNGNSNGLLTDGFVQPITNPGLLNGRGQGPGQGQPGPNGNMTNGANGTTANGQAGNQGGQANNFNTANGGNQTNRNQTNGTNANSNNTNGTATNPNGTVNPGNNRTNAPQTGTNGTNNSGTNNSNSNQPNPDNLPSSANGSGGTSGGGTSTPSAGPASGGGGAGGASGGGGGASGGGGSSGGGGGGASGGR